MMGDAFPSKGPTMRAAILAIALALLTAAPVQAQFVGPSARGAQMTVAAAAAARVDTYVSVEGTIASHLRGDYYVFRDDTDEIRVEIAPGVFAGRLVGQDTRVRLLGEVDRNAAGVTYLWVKAFDIL
jgi:uncharacterized protein (TIGR00156 family)